MGDVVNSISEYGVNLIKGFEGFSATPYRDAGGWSIGYGHYLGDSPTMSAVSPEQGAALLASDTSKAQSAIRALVTVPLSQNQFDALTSLIYNIGVGAFGKSTLLRLLNNSDYTGAADQFHIWNHSSGAVNSSLVARRAAERDVFLA